MCICNLSACYGYGQNVHLGANTKYDSNDSIFRGISPQWYGAGGDLVEPDILKLQFFGPVYYTFPFLRPFFDKYSGFR